MIKKIFTAFCLAYCLFYGRSVFAEGQVILDLEHGRPETKEESVPDLISFGARYLKDVKEYNELLDGRNIDKDITEDIAAKYPEYTPQMIEDWQAYVKKGVKTYRKFEMIKNRVVSWFMKQETPLVVTDNQYEMGNAETYIESDKPIVIQDFKKVVAYSNQPRDRLAAKEKYAKDHGLPRPSELIARSKKALLEKDWAVLLGFDWRQKLTELYEHPEGKSDYKEGLLKSAILSRFNGIGPDGKIITTIEIEPQKGQFVLLDDYKDYKGLNIDFEKSENLEDIKINFVMPQQLQADDNIGVIGYASRFSVYFEAKAKDTTLPVKLRPVISANLCAEDVCRYAEIMPELDLDVKKDVKETTFATYISTVAQNIPRSANKNQFEFKKLVFEENGDGNSAVLRLEVENKNAVYFKVFIFGEAAKHFEVPQMRIDNDKIVARFKLIDPQFNPIGKEINLWVSTGGTSQYLHKMKVEQVSLLDTEEGKVSLGILGLAFLGGLLLNLMPCVFPVLSLKLLAFTRFGGLNRANIRRNFTYNSLGILASFLVIAGILAGLKISGQALGWGMQFQNIYFLVVIIWIVGLFLAHVIGLLNLRAPLFADKILDKTQKGGRLFEFLSGVFLVLLSTPCMAPYLGTAFGVALAGSISDIVWVVLATGLGLAVPYLLLAGCPDIAVYMPRPGKWLGWINSLMVVMLIITLVWLISLLSAQTAENEFWLWGGYLSAMFTILFLRNSALAEYEKECGSQRFYVIKRRFNIVCAVILLGLMIFSAVDARKTATEHRDIIKNMLSEVPADKDIKALLRAGQRVLLKMGADWCLTCKYNEVFVFDVEYIQDALESNNVTVMELDWTHSNQKVLELMQKYGRRGLPFYVLFSAKYPNGIVLPEMLNAADFQTLIEM